MRQVERPAKTGAEAYRRDEVTARETVTDNGQYLSRGMCKPKDWVCATMISQWDLGAMPQAGWLAGELSTELVTHLTFWQLKLVSYTVRVICYAVSRMPDFRVAYHDLLQQKQHRVMSFLSQEIYALWDVSHTASWSLLPSFNVAWVWSDGNDRSHKVVSNLCC